MLFLGPRQLIQSLVTYAPRTLSEEERPSATLALACVGPHFSRRLAQQHRPIHEAEVVHLLHCCRPKQILLLLRLTVRVRDDPNWRYQTWREFGQERDDMCNHLVYEVIEPAQDTLLQALRNIETARQDPNTYYRNALIAAYNAMCNAERQLRDF